MIPYNNFRIFGQLITNASIGTIELVTSPTGVDMFVPLDSAFDGLDVEKWNQTFIDLVIFFVVLSFDLKRTKCITE